MRKILIFFLFLLSCLFSCKTEISDSLILVVGVGKLGFKDGKQAELNKPIRLAPYKENSVLFADINNHAIRIAKLDGSVITVAGGPDKKGYQDGLASVAKFNAPHGVAYDNENDIIYVAEAGNNLIRIITKSEEDSLIVTTLTGVSNEPGFRDGENESAKFNSPHAVILAEGGGVYVADIGNARIRLVKDGIVSTIAGNGRSGNKDGEPEGSSFVYAIDIASNGKDIFVADAGTNSIRRISPNVSVTTLKLNDSLSTPHGIAIDKNNNLYVADMGTHRILKINEKGEVTCIAGTGIKGSKINELNKPAAVLVHNNYLWIADLENHQFKVLRIE